MNFPTEYRCSLCMSRRPSRGIELHIQHNITPPMHMNIDPCMSKVKVDMTWETNSIIPLFPYLFDNSEPSSPRNIWSSDLSRTGRGEGNWKCAVCVN